MLFQSPEGSATKSPNHIESIYMGPVSERDAEGVEGGHEGEIDTHTKPGGLFYDVYVDLIPQEQAESVCAFVSPTHGPEPSTSLPNSNANTNKNSEKDTIKDKNSGKDKGKASNKSSYNNSEKEKDKESSGAVAVLNPSAFLSPVRTSSAGDIDCELRARLQVRIQLFIPLYLSHFVLFS